MIVPRQNSAYGHARILKQREAKQRCGANPEKLSQFRLQAETRLHEVGIASNRRG